MQTKKRRMLTSNTLSRAFTYIFLRPSDAPRAANATIKVTNAKRGVKKIVKYTNGVENISIFFSSLLILSNVLVLLLLLLF